MKGTDPATAIAWDLLGPGAMGLLWGTELHRRGCRVRLLEKEPGPASRIIQVEASGTTRTEQLPAACADDQLRLQVKSCLLVTLKTYHTLPALQRLRHLLTCYEQIVLLQNGMGVLEQIRAAFPGVEPLVGITSHGAWRRAPWHLVHAGAGDTWIGSTAGTPQPPACLEALMNLWNGRVQWTTDIHYRQWLKLGVNCIINGLAVLEECTNGGLLEDRHLPRITRLAEEIESIISAATGQLATGQLVPEVLRIARQTAANLCSMRQDLMRGAPTEIEHLHDHLCAQARRFGLAVPECEALTRALHRRLGS